MGDKELSPNPKPRRVPFSEHDQKGVIAALGRAFTDQEHLQFQETGLDPSDPNLDSDAVLRFSAGLLGLYDDKARNFGT